MFGVCSGVEDDGSDVEGGEDGSRGASTVGGSGDGGAAADEDDGTWGNKGRSSLFFFRQSAISLFMALGQLLRTLLRSGER